MPVFQHPVIQHYTTHILQPQCSSDCNLPQRCNSLHYFLHKELHRSAPPQLFFVYFASVRGTVCILLQYFIVYRLRHKHVNRLAVYLTICTNVRCNNFPRVVWLLRNSFKHITRKFLTELINFWSKSVHLKAVADASHVCLPSLPVALWERIGASICLWLTARCHKRLYGVCACIEKYTTLRLRKNCCLTLRCVTECWKTGIIGLQHCS